MSITPIAHLNFAGEARAALEFYGSVLGGQVAVTTYADAGMPAEAPGSDRVLFGQVLGERGPVVMAYDVPGATISPSRAGSTRREDFATLTDQPLFLAVGLPTLEQADALFTALGDGAEIVEPLASSAWSAGFGMLRDRFGVTWAISVVPVA